jgi:hypothetical protein
LRIIVIQTPIGLTPIFLNLSQNQNLCLNQNLSQNLNKKSSNNNSLKRSLNGSSFLFVK